MHEVAAEHKPAEKITYNIMDVVDEKNDHLYPREQLKQLMLQHKQLLLEDAGQTNQLRLLRFLLGFESESFGIPGKEHALTNGRCENGSLNVYEHIQEQTRQYKSNSKRRIRKIFVCGAGFLQGLNY